MNKDIGNYFYDVEFETLVYNDVYWVPVHSLGKTKYTSDEMIEICKLPLEEKRNKIDNLYRRIANEKAKEDFFIVSNSLNMFKHLKFFKIKK